MSRSERLLDLLNNLRRHRRPVSGRALAEETGVSLRTLYRDIASLQAQGATIEGEPGVGYVLKPGYLLPPLMFTPEEIEALALGSRWVAERADVGPFEELAGACSGSGGELDEGGALVTIAEPVRVQPADARSVFFVVEPDRAGLAALELRLRDGRLSPIVGAVRPLAEAASAFADRHTHGKTIIRITEG